MGRFLEALRQEAEASEENVRATIVGLETDGFVEWCKEAIASHEAMLKMAKSCLEPKPIILRSVGIDDEIAALELATLSVNWHNALIEVVRECRVNGEYIPVSWRDYLFDFFLKIRKKPDGRGKNSETIRNDAICRCIWSIQKFTRFKASRGESPVSIPCGISIVADALDNNPGYDGVERVWINRSVWFRSEQDASPDAAKKGSFLSPRDP